MASNNQNPNANKTFETVSGVTPDIKKLPYPISTTQVENWIAARVSALQAKSEGGSEPITVKVYSSESGKYFVPFVVTLSLNAIDDGKRNEKSHVDSFFTTGRAGGGRIRLKSYLFNLFKEYMYTEDDIRAFSSDDWRRARGVSRQTSGLLRNIATPTIMKNKNNGSDCVVYFLLDPLKVFCDMLRWKNDVRPFNVIIDTWNKQNNGEYLYYVIRKLDNGKKKGYGKSFIDEINYKMRTGNR